MRSWDWLAQEVRRVPVQTTFAGFVQERSTQTRKRSLLVPTPLTWMRTVRIQNIVQFLWIVLIVSQRRRCCLRLVLVSQTLRVRRPSGRLVNDSWRRRDDLLFFRRSAN